MRDKSIEGIVQWLRERNNAAGTHGFVVGLSGGIDSAVVAALCEQAFPGKTLAVIMPCHSNSQDAVDAMLVAEAIGCQVISVDLTDTYDTLLNSLNQSYQPENVPRMALANIKPRLRMASVYYYANVLGRLVVGTSNKDERYVGYFTKWGDGAADILPLAHLLKGEVRRLAQELQLPDEVISKPPSAGLWANQTDEQEMGLSYAELDAYLAGEQIDEKSKNRIEQLHRGSVHKLQLPPMMGGK